jgi:hypothetical protein
MLQWTTFQKTKENYSCITLWYDEYVFQNIYWVVFVNMSFIIRCFILIFYGHLCDLLKKIGSKPNAHSRLFAVLHEILAYACACKTTKKNDEWPGGLAYNSDVIQVWFPDGVKYYAFNLSLLKNEKEFYCCLRVSWKNCISYVPFPSVMTSANRIALISLQTIILRSTSGNWTILWFPRLIHLKHKKMRNVSTTWLFGCQR